MKITVIGGGGVRTPLLVNGLTRSDLPIDEIALFDTDRERLSVVASLAGVLSPSVRSYDDPRAGVAGASFIFLSIRAGGIAARAGDEAAAVAHGVVGQETIGPAGFAMAMRNAPPAISYVHLIAREAPRAWIINFTNPVAIVTQAMTPGAAGRVIGICDTPIELFERVAQVLGIEPARCYFDYFGLNHLGWLREVFTDGTPQLPRLWPRPDLLRQLYRAPLFDASFLQSLRLLPTEYLFYYYSPDAALEHMVKAGATRGRAIAEMNERLFHDLAAAGADRRSVYDRYLEQRSSSYMQIESGAGQSAGDSPWAQLTGYDKIALAVVRAIHFNGNAIIPLNVSNRGAIRGLDDDDIVEVPCVVNANGARPLTVAPIPEAARSLMTRVKEYERFTIEAARTRAIDDAVRALTVNPLVNDAALAQRLVGVLQLA
jgi:6-phospho-beta-glucosidase